MPSHQADEAVDAARVERVRVAALRSLEVLDTAVESDYDDLTALAASICGTPIAAISLVDAERQWFKSQIGLGVRETAREVSFCAHAITRPTELFVVPDAALDARFADNELVTADPSIRFYAGAPLVTSDGVALGSLCVLDQRPRQLTEEQYAGLTVLARQVTRLIEHRSAARRLLDATRQQQASEAQRQVAVTRFQRAFTLSATGMLVVAPDGRITQTNRAFADGLGLSPEQLQGRSVMSISTGQDRLAEADLARDLRSGARQQVRRERHFLHADGSAVPAVVTSCLLPASEAGDVELLDQVEWLTEQRRAEARLLEAQSAVDAIISIDAAGRVVSWNDGARRMFGHEQEDMLGRSITAIIPDRLAADHQAGVARLAAGNADRLIGKTVGVPAQRSDGTEFPVELSLSSWERGGNRYCTAILRDVTQAHRTAALLSLVQQAATVANDCAEIADAVERLLPALLTTGATAAWGWVGADGAGSRAATRWLLIGLHAGEAGGATPATPPPVSMPPRSLSVGRCEAPRPDADSAGSGPTAGGAAAREADLVRLQVPVLLQGRVCAVLELEGPDALGRDAALHAALEQVAGQLGQVAERAEAAAELTIRSRTDPLTGLANRRHLLELLEQALRDSTPTSCAAVLFLDLDNFKMINDSLGHAAGDDALRAVTARLTGLLRPTDTLARMGGDEFVLLCTALPDVLLAEAVAARVLAAFREPFDVQGTPLRIAASIGIADTGSTSGTDTPVSVLMQQADVAMYQAKASGGNTYIVFNVGMDDALQRNLETKRALDQALDGDELVLHYQPIVRPQDDLTLGLEALVRWERPGYGLVGPDAFVPLAEESGLIVPIGAWVLRTACQQMAAWHAQHPHLAQAYVAVNVSVAQLHPDFLSTVTEALQSAGLPARYLTLEITEGAMLHDLPAAIGLLTRLRRLGVRIALDDFGTGYSSLSYLRQLPLDVLKIDRSFVASLGSSPRADALIDVVLELARALDLTVVAEGAETAGHAHALHQRQCPAIQGYHYSRPLPAAQVPELTRRLLTRAG